MSYSGPSAVNPMMPESPYIPSSESAHSGRSSSPEHPGERVADSSMQPSLAMQYVNHANMTTTGYAYAQHGRLHGVTDVDVDEKPHLVYESMTEVQHQARQRMQMMNGGNNVKGNVEAGNQYAGIPNKMKPSKASSATFCMIHVIWNIFLFLIAVGAFGISVYTFLNKNEVSNGNNMVTTPPTGGQSMLTGDEEFSQVQIDELNTTIAELKAMLNQLSTTHQRHYLEVNDTIISAIQSIQSVSAANELDLTFGCVEEEAECVVNHEEAGTNTPSFATCETRRFPLTQPDLTNVNIYCSVDNAVGESNPLLATLHIYNAEISCVCSIVAISAASNSPTCKLNVRRCPNTIRLNTTNMP